MKIDLRDITFLMLIRLDSVERLENILVVTNQLCKYFDTNIMLLEADTHQNHVLKRMLNKNINYSFVEDKDPVLYKTRYFNKMATTVTTPYLSIWDADIVVDKHAIMDSVGHLRGGADVAYPYNGYCYDVPLIIRRLYLERNDVRILHRHKKKMEMLHKRTLVGGAVFVCTDKYKYCGMENEKHYGWGNDDFDRYYRFMNMGMNIYRTNILLFHLYHPRLENSTYRSFVHSRETISELVKIENNSGKELF